MISLDNHMYLYYFVIVHCLIGALSGLFYSFKLINYTFCDFKKANKVTYLNMVNPSFNSHFYTNTSRAATAAIVGLFISAYLITFFFFKYVLAGSSIFSDYLNTTILTTTLSMESSYGGFLLNFSYLNICVCFILLGLYFSKFKRVERNHNIYQIPLLLLAVLVCVFWFNFLISYIFICGEIF